MAEPRRQPDGSLVALVAAAGLLAIWPASSQAQGLSAQANEGLVLDSTRVTDETGRQTTGDSLLWLQKYRLALDEQLYPLLRLNAGGNLDWSSGRHTADGVTTDLDNKRYTLFGGLRFGSPILSGGLDADYRGEKAESRVAGVTSSSPGITRLGLAGSVSWRPADLPTVDLRLSRADTHDPQRLTLDLTTQDASLALRYQPDPTVQLQYSLRGSESVDHLAGVTSSDVTNSAAATWADTFASGRGNAYVSYNVGTRAGTVTVTGTGGGAARVMTRQLPVAGLSIVDGLTTTPDNVTLNPNDELIGADTSASAGLNLGTSASSVVQGTPREMGARFANRITPVDHLEVWIDRSAASVATLFSFSVWRSDDGTTWTSLANPLPAAAVRFSQIPGQFYFELDLPQTVQAEYLKVVVRPLPATATTDPQLATIWVTKLRFFRAQAADQVRGGSFALSGSFTASTRYRILDSPTFTYDGSLTVGHREKLGDATWSLVNGLSLQHRLSRVLSSSGRIDVAISDAGRGRETASRWSATLSAEPLPTLGGGATYAGVLSKGALGQTINQSLTAYGRADLYEGIGVSANGTANLGTTVQDQSQRSLSAGASLSLVPNRRFSLSTNASWSKTTVSGGGRPSTSDERGLVDVAATLVPFPTLSLSGGVTRVFVRGQDQTLASFSGSFTPFQGGALKLRYFYSDALDVQGATRTRTQGPGLRWNVRPGWFLDANYSMLDTTSPSQRLESQAFLANLNVNLL